MTPTLTPVKPEDAGTIEGPADYTHPTMKLYFAIRQVAANEFDSLYERILEKHNLGFVNPKQWAENMNAAIRRWNETLPDSATAIARAYEL